MASYINGHRRGQGGDPKPAKTGKKYQSPLKERGKKKKSSTVSPIKENNNNSKSILNHTKDVQHS